MANVSSGVRLSGNIFGLLRERELNVWRQSSKENQQVKCRRRCRVINRKISAVFRPTFRERAVNWLQRRSALAATLRIVKGKLTGDPRFVEHTRNDWLFSEFEVSQNFLSDVFWSRKQYPGPAEEASSLVLRELEAMQELTQ